MGYGSRLIVLICCGVVVGADWPTARCDSEQTAFQRDEKVLGVRNVSRLQRLWQQRLNTVGDRLTSAIMLGPIITDHGVKELVFSKDANTIYALDADLGSIFWTRTIGEDRRSVQRPAAYCADADKVSPVMNPPSHETDQTTPAEDSYSDGNQPMYVIGSDRRIKVIRPSTGGDLLPPFFLVPSPDVPVNLGAKDGVLYAVGARTCGGPPDRVWAKNIGASGLEIGSRAKASSFRHRKDSALAAFDWNGTELTISLTMSGKPSFELATGGERLFASSTSDDPPPRGVATWQDRTGERWICTSTGESVEAFQVQDRDGQPTAVTMWSVHRLRSSGPPSVANGVVYFLSQSGGGTGTHLILHALDARNGIELFNSREQIRNHSSSGDLAVANGHVCFSASEATLTCFGLPFAM